MFKKYYSLKAIPLGNIPDFLFHQIENDELFLTADVKLSGTEKMAHIESQSLADKFKEAIMPRLQKRYGEEFELEIIEGEGRDSKWLCNKIRLDSERVKKRLATGNYAPNKPV